MLELRAVDEVAVPASAPATSRLFMLPVAARRWVSTDNNVTVMTVYMLQTSQPTPYSYATISGVSSRLSYTILYLQVLLLRKVKSTNFDDLEIVEVAD